METHRLLMDRLIPKGATRAGEYSLRPRVDLQTGHWYPVRQTKAEVEDRVDAILDKYNSSFCRERGLEARAGLIYELLAEHPFSDGNGRLCRLLADHVLGSMGGDGDSFPIWSDLASPMQNYQKSGSTQEMVKILERAKVQAKGVETKQRSKSFIDFKQSGNHLTRNVTNLFLPIRREVIDENKGKQMSEDKHADDM